jgi:hypothetical protein
MLNPPHSRTLLKKRLALPQPLLPGPVISGLTASQGFVFSVFPVPALGGPGAAFYKALRQERKAITDQSVTGVADLTVDSISRRVLQANVKSNAAPNLSLLAVQLILTFAKVAAEKECER